MQMHCIGCAATFQRNADERNVFMKRFAIWPPSLRTLPFCRRRGKESGCWGKASYTHHVSRESNKIKDDALCSKPANLTESKRKKKNMAKSTNIKQLLKKSGPVQSGFGETQAK